MTYSPAILKKTEKGNAIKKQQNSFFKPVIQAKLTINQPNDIYEQEAEAMADKVMRKPFDAENDHAFFSPAGSIQRKCAHCEEEEKKLQRKESNNEPGVASTQTEDYVNSLSGGKALTGIERNFFEPRIGYDFSGVRLHTDSTAARSAQSINALAYTSRNNIVFNEGKYNTNTDEGKRLLGHELTHVVQQNESTNTVQKSAPSNIIQADFAVEPTTPNRAFVVLTAQQIQDAITFNQARHTDPTEIGLLRDILGISKVPQVIDDDFVNAVARYQAQYGLSRDGRLGHDTADRLAREIIATRDFMAPTGNIGSVAPEFILDTNIQALITANNTTYADYKTAIQAGTMIQQHVALRNQQLLTDLKGKLSWNNFARCVELMGRIPPTGADMLQDVTVLAAMNAAFAASNAGITRWTTPIPGHALAAACNPVAGAAAPAAHEEGGWIYLNLITGNLTTRRAVAGGQAAINLTNNAPLVGDSVIIGTFHTHPNVGACWGAVFPSGADTANAGTRGLPNLIQGAFPAVANIQRVVTGPARRNHLAGSRLIPGAGGGLAPQADVTGREVLE